MSAVAQPGAGSAAPAAGLWTGLSGRMILASGLLMLVLVAPFGVLLVFIELADRRVLLAGVTEPPWVRWRP